MCLNWPQFLVVEASRDFPQDALVPNPNRVRQVVCPEVEHEGPVAGSVSAKVRQFMFSHSLSLPHSTVGLASARPRRAARVSPKPHSMASGIATANQAIEAAQVIEELIQLAREMREANARGDALGLSEDELAFYDALETNDETVRNNVRIDWTLRENVRANLRRLVKRILRKHGYPPDNRRRPRGRRSNRQRCFPPGGQNEKRFGAIGSWGRRPDTVESIATETER